MAKKKQNDSTFLSELFSARLYKRNQGRLTRQLTAVAVVLLIGMGAYTLSQGWLQSFVDSYAAVEVTYPRNSDQGLASSLRQLGAEYGVDEIAGDSQPQSRQMGFRFSTDRFWRTQPDLRDEMSRKAQNFAEAVRARFGGQVTVSDPTHETETVTWISFGIPALVVVLAAWASYRMVNYPRFADFLISVEAELDKVSWPSWPELFRATGVVIGTMLFFGLVLFFYDIVWAWFFEKVGVLQTGGAAETGGGAPLQQLLHWWGRLPYWS